MQINGVNGAGMPNGNSKKVIGQEADAYSRQLQKQISDAQKKLQDISSDENLSAEEKMKKRQEIQQEINNLNIQLRQHQIELRKEKQEAKSSDSAVTELTGGGNNAKADKSSGQGSVMSEAGMSAVISADTAVKQARIQGSTAKRLENRAGVIKSEIKMESGDTSDKEKALAETEKRAAAATASSMNTLKEAGEELKRAEHSKEEDKKASGADTAKEEKGSGATDNVKNNVYDNVSDNVNDKESRNASRLKEKEETDSDDSTAKQESSISYTPVDIRL